MGIEQRYESGQVKFIIDKGGLDWIKNKVKNLSPQKRDGAIEHGFKNLTAATEEELKYKVISGQVLKVRTGALLKSIGSIIGRSGGNLVGLVGSGVRTGKRLPYANIHETGGKIVAKNPSGYLWIPIRKGGDAAIALGLSRKRISFSSKVISYRRVRSVTIPARRYMTIATDHIQPRAVGIIMDAIDEEIQKDR